MTDDIVTRLREECESLKVDVQVVREAADEIERLRAERDRWREVAKGLSCCVNEDSHSYGCLGYKFDGWCVCDVARYLKAVRGE